LKASGAANRGRQRAAERRALAESCEMPLYLRNLPAMDERRARQILWKIARGDIRDPEGSDDPRAARWRIDLAWLRTALMGADESSARYRALGPPPKGEAERRQWEAALNAEALFQRATFPGIAPEKRFEGITRGVGTAGMISDKAKLGEIVEEMERMTAALPGAHVGAK